MSRFGIKKSYSIKGQRYKVLFMNRVDEADSFGECDSEGKVIKIKKGMSPEKTWITFIHEVGHAVSYEIGTHNMPSYSADQEDITVDGVATQLVSLFDFRDKE